jgi:hypothetical protein
MTSAVLERETTEQTQTGGSKSEQAHIVMSPNADESHHGYVMRARIEGFAITALCGYTWVPNKSATGLPVCPECREIWDALPDDGGGWVRE